MNSKFNKLFSIIMQELTQAQKELTDTYAAKRSQNLSFGPFKNQRTYFPLPKHEAVVLTPPQNIVNELDQAGFYITDYRNGTAVKKTIQGQKPDLRQVKIGKILSRLNKPELKKEFDQRLAGNLKEVNKDLSICITHNPYDIAGMSTDRNWTSCMNLQTGAFKQTPLIEVQYGGMCAYLIDSDDKEIEHPYARIAIKRLIDRAGLKNYIFLQQPTIYGDVTFAKEMFFDSNVKKILDKSNQYTSGDVISFERDDGEHTAYSDGALNKSLYFKDLRKLDEKIQNGQIVLDIDYTHELIQSGKLEAWFLIKYMKDFELNMRDVFQYNTFTPDELDKVIQSFYYDGGYQKLTQKPFEIFKINSEKLYNSFH